MSQPAVGTFSGEGNKFTGTFVAQKNVVLLNGIFSQAVMPFTVAVATVMYKKLSDFKGEYDIEISSPGFVGETTVNITFVNDDSSVKLPLTGILATPLQERQVVGGFGTFILIPTP
ncbi:hypothetical protein F5887DRAFT_514489 [Amanita rubescens]|nr:hypothetical protein F5887DRAFT_514489 [Amanita rubescens]